MALKLPIALVQKESVSDLISPEDATPQVDYYCPGCQGVVRLRRDYTRKTGAYVSQHFFHMTDTDSCSFESLAHLLGKRKIRDLFPNDPLYINRKCQVCDREDQDYHRFYQYPIFSSDVVDVSEEYTVKIQGKTYRLDLALLGKDQELLFGIEICHTHAVDDNKRDALNAAGIRWCEIDVNDLFGDIDPNEVTQETPLDAYPLACTDFLGPDPRQECTHCKKRWAKKEQKEKEQQQKQEAKRLRKEQAAREIAEWGKLPWDQRYKAGGTGFGICKRCGRALGFGHATRMKPTTPHIKKSFALCRDIEICRMRYDIRKEMWAKLDAAGRRGRLAYQTANVATVIKLGKQIIEARSLVHIPEPKWDIKYTVSELDRASISVDTGKWEVEVEVDVVDISRLFEKDRNREVSVEEAFFRGYGCDTPGIRIHDSKEWRDLLYAPKEIADRLMVQKPG